MGKIFSGNTSSAINIVTGKIRKEIKKGNKQRKPSKKIDIKNSSKSGNLIGVNWNNINIGIHMINDLVSLGLHKQRNKLLSGEQDISRMKKQIIGLEEVIKDALRGLMEYTSEEVRLQEDIKLIAQSSVVAQAARDGILVKQNSREEIINGEKKQIIYDTTMNEYEVLKILQSYDRDSKSIKMDQLENYLRLGLGVYGTLGTIIKEREENDKNVSLIPIANIAVRVLNILERFVNEKKDDRDLIKDIRDLNYEITYNENVSEKEQKSKINEYCKMQKKNIKANHKQRNKKYMFDIGLDLLTVIFTGIYLKDKIIIKENGKIDGKSLAKALVNINGNNITLDSLIRGLNSQISLIDRKKETDEIKEQAKDILKQMKEKVYPLQGATHPFNSISVKNLEGKFYPKKDYETGEILFGTKIKVPEFSLKRGDVVLLSGESGAGKSTFLRLLKRGDINNRKAIQLDNCEKVDNLGSEFISYKPDMHLDSSKNVLYQLTGKDSISELTKEEKDKLKSILVKMKFPEENLLAKLASKNFNEFSTGQQIRLSLSKLFYKINDETSIIIVDEPVGNVEEELIRKQLEMIKQYAKEQNLMLILTTHRLDLAESIADKRYHINSEGVLEEIRTKKREKEEFR